MMKTRFLILAIVIPVAIVGIIFSPLILEAYYLEKKYLQIGYPQDYENCTDTNECMEWLENGTCKTMLTTRCAIPEPKSEDNDFEKTWSGPGNRHPAFFGYEIADSCTEDMVKYLVRYTNIFTNEDHLVWNQAGLPDHVNVKQFDICFDEQKKIRYVDFPKEIEGYAVDYDGNVQYLPFADVCTNEMKIFLLTYSNIASPEEHFVMEDVELPSGMNQEDFGRCAHETEFTKSRWNMVSMENPGSQSNPSQRYHVSVFQNSKTMKPYVTPDFITIGPGEKVTWSNYDKIPHEIFSNDSISPWSTGRILPDGYATITFNKTGIYEYRGNPGTHGFIVVMDDDGQLLESKFSTVFGHSSPLVYNEELKPVFLYDNCERYVYWLNEHSKEKITLSEDYPRYPPWGNQIFPLVEFCTSNGKIVNTGDENSVHWEFRIENEN